MSSLKLKKTQSTLFFLYSEFMNHSVLLEQMCIFFSHFFPYNLFCTSDILSTFVNIHIHVCTLCTVTLTVWVKMNWNDELKLRVMILREYYFQTNRLRESPGKTAHKYGVHVCIPIYKKKSLCETKPQYMHLIQFA